MQIQWLKALQRPVLMLTHLEGPPPSCQRALWLATRSCLMMMLTLVPVYWCNRTGRPNRLVFGPLNGQLNTWTLQCLATRRRSRIRLTLHEGCERVMIEPLHASDLIADTPQPPQDSAAEDGAGALHEEPAHQKLEPLTPMGNTSGTAKPAHETNDDS